MSTTLNWSILLQGNQLQRVQRLKISSWQVSLKSVYRFRLKRPDKVQFKISHDYDNSSHQYIDKTSPTFLSRP